MIDEAWAWREEVEPSGAVVIYPSRQSIRYRFVSLGVIFLAVGVLCFVVASWTPGIHPSNADIGQIGGTFVLFATGLAFVALAVRTLYMALGQLLRPRPYVRLESRALECARGCAQ